jgi:hypothetical protein
LTDFLSTASEEEIAEYVAARGIFDEDEIAEGLIEIRGSGEIRTLKNYGLSPRVAFSWFAQSGREKQLKWAVDMFNLLDSWPTVDVDIREKITGVYYGLVVHLELNAKTVLVKAIQDRLGKCFLEFSDGWDQI